MIDHADLQVTSIRDAATMEDMERGGSVPWSLFAREKAWREELQAALGDVLAPPTRSNDDPWPLTPEAVVELRGEIQGLLDAKQAILEEMDRAREEIAAEVSELEEDLNRKRTMARLEAALIVPEHDGDLELAPYMDLCEMTALKAALRASGGIREAAARRLGISRTTIYKKLSRHGL